MNPHQKRPAGLTALSFFFVFGALASGLATIMILMPGTTLDELWRLNPRARDGFVTMGHWAGWLMFTVCLACTAAAIGLWHLRRWGYWLATIILCVNLVGDTVNSFVLHDLRTVVGVPIAGLMITYLWMRRTAFDR